MILFFPAENLMKLWPESGEFWKKQKSPPHRSRKWICNSYRGNNSFKAEWRHAKGFHSLLIEGVVLLCCFFFFLLLFRTNNMILIIHCSVSACEYHCMCVCVTVFVSLCKVWNVKCCLSLSSVRVCRFFHQVFRIHNLHTCC